MNTDIKETAKLFLKLNGTVEVRVIAVDAKNPDKTVIASGYYNEVDALVGDNNVPVLKIWVY